MVSQINCLNLCEIVPCLHKKKTMEEILPFAMQAAGYEKCSRVYFGSYFCGKYFLHQTDSCIQELMEVCNTMNIKATLVIPTFSEGDLERGKQNRMKMSLGRLSLKQRSRGYPKTKGHNK